MGELVLIQSKFPTDTFVTSESKLSERESKIWNFVEFDTAYQVSEDLGKLCQIPLFHKND